ncbi:MAG: ROK family protein [Eubacteriales bacterium]|nr:ROK family protein [Eubacteriales bacterium]
MKIMVLDIGGTAIKAGICTAGQLEDIREFPTEASLGGEHVMKRAGEIIADYREKYAFERIGVSTAGQVDPVKGSIIYANQNIPGYTGMQVAGILRERFQVPVAVENDVNAAAVGEAVFGAGRGQQEFVCLTYGTGVGGAVFTGGHLYRGSSCSAGEFGAIIVHPEERNPREDMFSGCYEKYASVTALVARAKKVDGTLTDGRKIFACMDEPAVKAVIDAWILEIVYGLTTIVHTLNPSCIILGGGVMEQPCLTEQIKLKLNEHIMPSFAHVKLRKAELGNRAGMLGAAAAAAEKCVE